MTEMERVRMLWSERMDDISSRQTAALGKVFSVINGDKPSEAELLSAIREFRVEWATIRSQADSLAILEDEVIHELTRSLRAFYLPIDDGAASPDLEAGEGTPANTPPNSDQAVPEADSTRASNE